MIGLEHSADQMGITVEQLKINYYLKAGQTFTKKRRRYDHYLQMRKLMLVLEPFRYVCGKAFFVPIFLIFSLLGLVVEGATRIALKQLGFLVADDSGTLQMDMKNFGNSKVSFIYLIPIRKDYASPLNEIGVPGSFRLPKDSYDNMDSKFKHQSTYGKFHIPAFESEQSLEAKNEHKSCSRH